MHKPTNKELEHLLLLSRAASRTWHIGDPINQDDHVFLNKMSEVLPSLISDLQITRIVAEDRNRAHQLCDDAEMDAKELGNGLDHALEEIVSLKTERDNWQSRAVDAEARLQEVASTVTKMKVNLKEYAEPDLLDYLRNVVHRAVAKK